MRFGSTQGFYSLRTFSSCASVNYYYKFEIPLISSIFYKWRVDCCILRFSQAAPLAGVHRTLPCKNMFLLLSLQKTLCSHTWTIMRPNTPFFFGLLFDLLLFCCLCPYGNVTNQQSNSFPLWFLIQNLLPCGFLFVLGSRLMLLF